MILHRLLLIAGMLLILPVSLLTTLALFTPITLSGTLYLLGALLIAVGAISPGRGQNRGVTGPSVGWRGDWWTSDGQQTVRNTLDYLHARGVKRVYLAGLSNGAVGTCRMAPHLSSELAGLILISGADPHAPDTGLPLLALQGDADQRMPAALAIQATQHAGKRGTYREFHGDHLLLAKRAREVQEVLAAWLRQQEDNTGVHAAGRLRN